MANIVILACGCALVCIAVIVACMSGVGFDCTLMGLNSCKCNCNCDCNYNCNCN